MLQKSCEVEFLSIFLIEILIPNRERPLSILFGEVFATFPMPSLCLVFQRIFILQDIQGDLFRKDEFEFLIFLEFFILRKR